MCKPSYARGRCKIEPTAIDRDDSNLWCNCSRPFLPRCTTGPFSCCSCYGLLGGALRAGRHDKWHDLNSLSKPKSVTFRIPRHFARSADSFARHRPSTPVAGKDLELCSSQPCSLLHARLATSMHKSWTVPMNEQPQMIIHNSHGMG